MRRSTCRAATLCRLGALPGLALVSALTACTAESAGTYETGDTGAAVEEPVPCVATFAPLQRPAAEFGWAAAEDALPQRLSETGLYEGAVGGAIHPAMRLYEPEFSLWSDGSEKARWVYLPECDTIDVSDPDNWQLPVGARLFKEFRIDGVRVETRLITRLVAGDYAYASYLWNEDETEAEKVGPDGVLRAKGFDHDVPSKDQCLACHGTHGQGGGRPSRALGFSAIQLHASSGPLSLVDLVADGVFDGDPGQPVIPGDAETRAALGTLHANCGNCHNASVDGITEVDLNLWLDVDDTTVEGTGVWRTAVGQPTTLFTTPSVSGRIVPGSPEESAVLYRMLQRGNNAQMPPIATHIVDEDGSARVRTWIEKLP